MMTPDINSRARQLLVDIGLKEPAWNPLPENVRYDLLVACVADHLRQVAAKARDALKAELEVSEAVNKTKTLSLTSLRALLAEAGKALDDINKASSIYVAIQTALRESPPPNANPLDFP